MPDLDVIDIENKKVGTVEASVDVFDTRVNDELVQRYVTMQLAARRGGNAATKQNKGDLHGSNKKPWKQKGTGRARSGNTRSPLWRGGMTVFGPSPRSYAFTLSKKSKKLALRSVLTEKFASKFPIKEYKGKNGKFTVYQIPLQDLQEYNNQIWDKYYQKKNANLTSPIYSQEQISDILKKNPIIRDIAEHFGGGELTPNL